jgi:ATP-dependent Zn protease
MEKQTDYTISPEGYVNEWDIKDMRDVHISHRTAVWIDSQIKDIIKQSQKGMIKIEDVEKILAKYLEDEDCDYETWNVEELYEGIKTDLDKLKELGEK